LIAASKNGFLPFTGKLLKGMGYLVTSLVRIGCVTLFFGLPLGILNILNILIHKNSLASYREETRDFVYDTKVEDGKLIVIRLNEIYSVMKYTDLTGVPLKWFGISFLNGVIVHILLVTLVKKLAFGEGFSQLPKMEKFLHILHTVAFPESSVDWDYGNTGTLETYKRQWEAFKRENIFMLALFTIENILMTVPVFFICTKVINYHLSLPYTIEIENGAYDTAWILRIVWPVIVLLTPVLQWLLMVTYNKFGHPWKSIHAKFSKNTSGAEKLEDLKDDGESVEESSETIPGEVEELLEFVSRQVEAIQEEEDIV